MFTNLAIERGHHLVASVSSTTHRYTKSRRRRGCIRQQTQKLLPVGDHFEGEMFHFTRQKL